MVSVQAQEDALIVASDGQQARCQPLTNRCFASELGLFEFEESQVAGDQVLVWGRATRYFPVNANQ